MLNMNVNINTHTYVSLSLEDGLKLTRFNLNKYVFNFGQEKGVLNTLILLEKKHINITDQT